MLGSPAISLFDFVLGRGFGDPQGFVIIARHDDGSAAAYGQSRFLRIISIDARLLPHGNKRLSEKGSDPLKQTHESGNHLHRQRIDKRPEPGHQQPMAQPTHWKRSAFPLVGTRPSRTTWRTMSRFSALRSTRDGSDYRHRRAGADAGRFDALKCWPKVAYVVSFFDQGIVRSYSRDIPSPPRYAGESNT